MAPRVHFISGLPRSGSTLLSALLKQNPRFFAAVTSPVAALTGALTPKMSSGGEFSTFFDDEKRLHILRGVFESYYADRATAEVVFDTNRIWTGKLPVLLQLYPNARVICCVREIGWIIESVEQMLRTNPTQVSRIFDYKPGTSIYGRVETLMNSDNGLVGLPWASLREAWYGPFANRLIIVNYENFAGSPKPTLQQIYREIGEPWFDHDFENVVYDEPEYDEKLGMPGLHKVKSKVEYQRHDPTIPPDLFAKYADLSFWRRPESNRNRSIVI
jgi:sulfotransferase